MNNCVQLRLMWVSNFNISIAGMFLINHVLDSIKWEKLGYYQFVLTNITAVGQDVVEIFQCEPKWLTDLAVAQSESRASLNCECAAVVWWNNCQTCIEIIGKLSHARGFYSDPYHNTCISVRSRSGGEDSLDLTMWWNEFKYAWQHAPVWYSLPLKIKQWMRGSSVSSYPLVLSL